MVLVACVDFLQAHDSSLFIIMDHISQIKARLPITDVVGTYIKLERAGGNFRALCPFHKEKTPSFNVSPARDAYYCFGCAKGGDIFTFVQEIEGMSFPEAMRMLADRAGVVIPEKNTQLLEQQKTLRDKLIDLMHVASDVFQAEYRKQPEVAAYLHGRGLTDETIFQFGIGFAPLAWRNLYEALRAKGFGDQLIEQARLVKKIEGKGYYDTFRGRVMFPIWDSAGRIVAFTGRVFGDQKAPDGTPVAKYLNSPEGELYHKSRILFGYHFAKVPIRKADQVIVVEGQMDCIMSHQAGYAHTVAISGTALTIEQLDLLKRLTNNITFALDADSAGIIATLRSARLALAEGMVVRVAAIPDGKDPADFIAAHPKAWGDVLNRSETIVPYVLKQYVKQGLTKDSLREKILKDVFPLIAVYPSKIAQAQAVSEVARLLNVREEVVFEDLKIALAQAEHTAIEQLQNASSSTLEERTPTVVGSELKHFEEDLCAILSWQGALSQQRVSVEEMQEKYVQLCIEFGRTPLVLTPEMQNQYCIIAETKYADIEHIQDIIDELFDRIERTWVKAQQESLVSTIREREQKGEDVSLLIREYGALTPRIIQIEDRMRARSVIL